MKVAIDPSVGKSSLSRVVWLDYAKSYGMILVFLGHILEAFYNNGFESVFLTYKAIYSFHIPLFFLLSGYLSKIPVRGFWAYLKIRKNTRVIPFLFFNFMALLGLFLLDFLGNNLNILGYLRDSFSLLKGVPAFNITTWFLTCLLAVEIINFISCKFFKTERSRLLVALTLFALGWGLTARYRGLVMNYWFFPEAMVAYLFYVFGAALKHRSWFSRGSSFRVSMGFLIASLVVLLTFNLNQSLFFVEPPVVFMGLSSRGQPLLFLITGLAGSLAVIYLARWVSSSQFLNSFQHRLGIRFIGMNTLILLGLNGLLMPFNHKLAALLSAYIPDNPVIILTLGVVLTAVSLLLCVPLVLGLKRFLPQFVGLSKPQSVR